MSVAALVLVAVLAQAQAPPPRDAAPRAAAGAVIRGRVVSASTRQPLHRVKVTLRPAGGAGPAAVTDLRGRFELTNVPPGAYTLAATRSGYLPIQYGQRRPRESGRTFDLKNGDVLEGIDLSLYKGGVIAGRVIDELGEPAAAARVEAVELRYIRGRRARVAAKIATTNDAGEYRLSGLDPGSYEVRASTAETWESDDGKTAYAFALTYYPGVTATDRPESITVALGQEAAGIDLRLVPGAAARVSGVLVGANGEPLAGEVIGFDRITRGVNGVLVSAGQASPPARTDERGAFEFSKLPAGEYMVYTTGPNDRASSAVFVSPGDARSVTLTPHRATAVSGSITTDEGTPPPFPAARASIDPILTDPAFTLPLWNAARPAAAGSNFSFRIGNLDGDYLFRVNGLPDGWMLKSVQLGDRDYTDTPLRIPAGSPDVTGLALVLTRAVGALSGDVTDSSGASAPDAAVIVFAEEPARWGIASRYIRMARPDNAGKFSVTGLLPGVYRAIAREAVVDGQWEDAEFLQGLVKDAVRVEIAERAKAEVKLTVSGGVPR